MRAVRFGSYSIAEDRRRHAGLVALEVDHAIALLVTAARKREVMRPWLLRPTFCDLVLEQALLGLALRDLAEVLRGHATTTRRGWLVKPNGHGLDALEELDVVAGLQRDERLLPRRTLTGEPTNALHLAAHDERADVGDGDLEQLLDRVRGSRSCSRRERPRTRPSARTPRPRPPPTAPPPVSRRRALFSVRSGRLMMVCAARMDYSLPFERRRRSASTASFVRTSVSWRRMS